MDINKLFTKVITDDDVKNVPLIYIITVFNCIMDAIGTGECFYTNE